MTGRVCCRCRQLTDRAAMVLVGVPFANSGPGGPASYACLPCARIYAVSPLAPEWIADEIAARDVGLDIAEVPGKRFRGRARPGVDI